MDNTYDELKVKFEAENLREECRAKTRLADGLKKAHTDQQAKIQQAKLEIEKLAQELNAKSEEICEIRQMYKELQSSLQKKDLFLQQFSSANEKLRAEHGEKILKLEAENRELLVALGEASARIQDLEKKTSASDEEIAGLKRLLSFRPEKDFEAQKNASKYLKDTDEYILKLEEENRTSQDQLKWKNEQFSHLEEAHHKLQTQFQSNMMEWQKEKSSLIDEVSLLQTALDAQMRISESLENQLRMCNQALAHEESRRKVLEIEMSESRTQFENVFLDCQLARSKIEQLTMKRDEEIAELRNLLRKRDIVGNEMKYRTVQLEQENNDLLGSLKNVQAAQLNNNATSSLKKLRNKLQGLEQLHHKCASNLKEKETEWNSQIEKLERDFMHCLSELDSKNKSTGAIQKELEDCQCQLEVKNEEIFALVLVLKSEFHIAYSKLYDAKEKLSLCMNQIEEKNMFLIQQLELKNTELHKVNAELKQRCDEIAVLRDRVESLESLSQKKLIEGELKRHKEMLDESNECQIHFKEQCLKLENAQREDRKNAFDALEMANSELANKTSELEKSNLELQKWKFDMEILELKLEENQQTRKQENASLLVTLNDQDAKIGKLQEQIHVLESLLEAKSEAAEMLRQENINYMQIADNRSCCLESLQNEIAQLRNELAEREAGGYTLSDANKALEQKNEKLLFNIKEKDQKIQEFEKQVESLEQDFRSTVLSFAEKECILDEALKTAEDQKIVEIKEKNQIIFKLEKEVKELSSQVKFQDKNLIQLMQEALQLESSFQSKELEVQELKGQLAMERRCFEGLVEELKSHRQALLEDLEKTSIGKEDMLAQLEGICEQFGVICRDNAELMDMLGKMLYPSEDDRETARDLLTCSGFSDTILPPSRKAIQVTVHERSPLTELNF